MDKNVSKELKEALDILGLNYEASKEKVLERSKKLRAVYEDSDTAEDMAKLSEIYKASQIVLHNMANLSKLNLTESKGQKSTLPSENNFNNNTFEKKKLNLNKSVVTVTILIIAALFIGLGISYFHTSDAKYQEMVGRYPLVSFFSDGSIAPVGLSYLELENDNNGNRQARVEFIIPGYVTTEIYTDWTYNYRTGELIMMHTNGNEVSYQVTSHARVIELSRPDIGARWIFRR